MQKRIILLGIIFFSILPLFFIWSIEYLPFTDYPNHLVRANIIKSYEYSEFYQRYFSINFFHGYLPIPNIIFDLFAVKLLPFIHVDIAGKVFLSLYVLLSLLSSWILCSEIDADRETVLLGYLAVLYSLFFNMALLNFIFSIPLVILSITVLLKFYKNGKSLYLVIFIFLLILVYLSHIFSFVLLSLVFIFSTVLSQSRRRALLVLIASLCIIATGFYLVSESISEVSLQQYPIGMKYKLHLLPLYFLSYPANYVDYNLGMLILISYSIGLLWLLGSLLIQNRRCVILILVLFIIYLLLPFSNVSGTLIDARMLPFIILLILICSCKFGRCKQAIVIILFCIALSLKAYGSFIYYSAFLNNFPKVMVCIDKVETGARLLPVISVDETNINAYTHSWGYELLKKDIVTPYIFAGTYQPLKYRHSFFAPSHLWGYNGTYDEPKAFWDNLKNTYDYILIFGRNEKLRIAVEEIGYKIFCNTEISTLYSLK